MFRLQTNMAACEKRGICHFQFWELLQLADPQIHRFEDKKGFYRLKKNMFLYFTESGQPYYEPFMDSD